MVGIERYRVQAPDTMDQAHEVRTGYDALNRLAVEIQGRSIRTFVNGVQVGNVQAHAPVTGFIGFTVGMPGMEVVFTNVRVTEFPKPGVTTSRTNRP